MIAPWQKQDWKHTEWQDLLIYNNNSVKATLNNHSGVTQSAALADLAAEAQICPRTGFGSNYMRLD